MVKSWLPIFGSQSIYCSQFLRLFQLTSLGYHTTQLRPRLTVNHFESLQRSLVSKSWEIKQKVNIVNPSKNISHPLFTGDNKTKLTINFYH